MPPSPPAVQPPPPTPARREGGGRRRLVGIWAALMGLLGGHLGGFGAEDAPPRVAQAMGAACERARPHAIYEANKTLLKRRRRLLDQRLPAEVSRGLHKILVRSAQDTHLAFHRGVQDGEDPLSAAAQLSSPAYIQGLLPADLRGTPFRRLPQAWKRVVRYARAHNENLVALYASGWWCEDERQALFLAAMAELPTTYAPAEALEAVGGLHPPLADPGHRTDVAEAMTHDGSISGGELLVGAVSHRVDRAWVQVGDTLQEHALEDLDLALHHVGVVEDYGYGQPVGGCENNLFVFALQPLPGSPPPARGDDWRRAYTNLDPSQRAYVDEVLDQVRGPQGLQPAATDFGRGQEAFGVRVGPGGGPQVVFRRSTGLGARDVVVRTGLEGDREALAMARELGRLLSEAYAAAAIRESGTRGSARLARVGLGRPALPSALVSAEARGGAVRKAATGRPARRQVVAVPGRIEVSKAALKNEVKPPRVCLDQGLLADLTAAGPPNVGVRAIHATPSVATCQEIRSRFDWIVDRAEKAGSTTCDYVWLHLGSSARTGVSPCHNYYSGFCADLARRSFEGAGKYQGLSPVRCGRMDLFSDLET